MGDGVDLASIGLLSWLVPILWCCDGLPVRFSSHSTCECSAVQYLIVLPCPSWGCGAVSLPSPGLPRNDITAIIIASSRFFLASSAYHRTLWLALISSPGLQESWRVSRLFGGLNSPSAAKLACPAARLSFISSPQHHKLCQISHSLTISRSHDSSPISPTLRISESQPPMIQVCSPTRLSFAAQGAVADHLVPPRPARGSLNAVPASLATAGV